MNISYAKAFRCIPSLVLTGLVGVAGAASPARAESLIWDGSLKNCTQQNCGAVFLNGISQKNAFGDSVPFTASLFASAGECLRLEATNQSADMEITVAS